MGQRGYDSSMHMSSLANASELPCSLSWRLKYPGAAATQLHSLCCLVKVTDAWLTEEAGGASSLTTVSTGLCAEGLGSRDLLSTVIKLMVLANADAGIRNVVGWQDAASGAQALTTFGAICQHHGTGCPARSRSELQQST